MSSLTMTFLSIHLLGLHLYLNDSPCLVSLGQSSLKISRAKGPSFASQQSLRYFCCNKHSPAYSPCFKSYFEEIEKMIYRYSTSFYAQVSISTLSTGNNSALLFRFLCLNYVILPKSYLFSHHLLMFLEGS